MMKPTYSNVFITEVEKATMTKGGIILAGGGETGIKPGEVLAVGPDVTNVKPGDKVYVKWGDGVPVTHEGVKGALVSTASILAVI